MFRQTLMQTLTLFILGLATTPGPAQEAKMRFTGRVIDSETGDLLPARVYLRSADGAWHHVHSVSPKGSAVPYRRHRGSSVEIHTTISAHAFFADLSAGEYQLEIERGKEYLPAVQRIVVGPQGANVETELRRWVDMASRGWYSGDTHVHRGVNELPNVVLAEDLNVALPLTYWVTDSRETPATKVYSRKQVPGPELIRVDEQHVIWPVNTEYEIFTYRGKRHTLGALFFLNHRTPLELAAPPVAPIVDAARAQGRQVLLDLDKHNWPWSIMLIPAADVNLFELTNNHIWRTEFLFSQWYPGYAADYMQIERNEQGGFTERGWIDFGLKTYYALLNCGFSLQPSAGTASGVHPVPLGFGRVYVHLPDGLDYDRWIAGLGQGRSFVTTGPMLTATFNGADHGHRFESDQAIELRIEGSADSEHPLRSIEIVVNGQVARELSARNRKTEAAAYRSEFSIDLPVETSSWIALRCFEDRPDRRPRFAHTSPVHVHIAGSSLRPRTAEVEYLVGRVADEIERHRGTLSEDELREYKAALKRFESLRARARR